MISVGNVPYRLFGAMVQNWCNCFGDAVGPLGGRAYSASLYGYLGTLVSRALFPSQPQCEQPPIHDNNNDNKNTNNTFQNGIFMCMCLGMCI